MKPKQQDLPFRNWGGARRGAGRKRQSARRNVPHRPREKFRKGALHVTLPLRREVWNLRTHRCFRALKRAFVRGCERFGYRVVEFWDSREVLERFLQETIMPMAQRVGLPRFEPQILPVDNVLTR